MSKLTKSQAGALAFVMNYLQPEDCDPFEVKRTYLGDPCISKPDGEESEMVQLDIISERILQIVEDIPCVCPHCKEKP